MKIIIILLIYACIVLFLGCWTDSNLDFWLTHLKGIVVDCPFWLSALLSVAAPLMVVFNVIAEIGKLLI